MHPTLDAFFAQAAPDGGGLGGFTSLVPILLMFVVFYFLLIRPQQKQAKKHQEFLGQLQRGSEVYTQGGIIGRIHEVGDKFVTLDVGGGVKMRFVKGQVAGGWSDQGPVKAEAKK
ncbi:MAG TPA: preprotein translocase subunit YajC [Anaeromyxobacteraceae bacterium]|nr:preprotein translocase subunit YajC [Anaeromyxobacteraceae bacterium]